MKELGVPALSPFHVDKMVIKSGSGPVRLSITVTDLDIRGFEKLNVKTLKGFEKNFDGKTITLTGSVPKILVNNYMKLTGQVLIVPVNSQGNSTIQMHDVKFNVKFRVKSVLKNEKEHMQVDKLKMNMEIKK